MTPKHFTLRSPYRSIK